MARTAFRATRGAWITRQAISQASWLEKAPLFVLEANLGRSGRQRSTTRGAANSNEMTTVWLIGAGDWPLKAALEAAGHAVQCPEVSFALSGSQDSADVAFIRPGGEPAVILARRLSLGAPATAWVLLLPSASPDQVSGLLDAGAADVAIEPLAAGSALAMVARLVRERRLRVRLEVLESQAAELDQVLGESPAMRVLLEQVSRIARRSAQGPPIRLLLTGETGTGKGLLARRIHQSGRRRGEPFIELNCAALPAGLLESELFGYERGAFTDARSAKLGLIEAADRGTLFLDEVSYLSGDGQAKLLVVLDRQRVRRLGGTSDRQVDVQVIAASSQDMSRLVAEGRFLPELFHRLGVLWLKLPPLRERGDDAQLIAERLLDAMTSKYRLPPKRLSPSARAAIRAYGWPGNVRELSNAIERAVLVEEGDLVETAHLALHGATPAVEAGPGGEIRVCLPPGGASLENFERAIIVCALRAEQGNVSRAAELLRTTRDTLRWRIDKHGIAPTEWSRSP
ncbi:MAG: sigma 54-interacting transcriptional regulator [Myxococcaceae bacterium]